MNDRCAQVEQLVARDLGGILLFDPLNIRYATDTTNMQLWTAHNPARACFVAASGHVVLWDFHGCDHLSAHLPLISELRSGASAPKSTRYCAVTPATIAGWPWTASRSPACEPSTPLACRCTAARRSPSSPA
ncbi:hypothetical protein [Pseudomonas plecoglossicida]|uniref:hypothetical protein n=1 Tax=Pseudomonas plecoglossicida TaxID=70775 RepID=UPI0012DC4CEB|nr:hypothetical protein [Pseudomonas plecoglossicida]